MYNQRTHFYDWPMTNLCTHEVIDANSYTPCRDTAIIINNNKDFY